jgi:homoserine O-acetyltransferase/O-succinyltransferase
MSGYHWVVDDFEAGDLPLSGGGVLSKARLHYHQIGQLNAPKDNLIVLPTYYGGAAAGNRPWVGNGSPLDPDRYCILIPAMLGAGESSSPSNTLGDQAGPAFPRVSLYDNVMLQKRLVDHLFPGASIALVMGWSMGGMQALQWGTLFPDRVRAVLATCCTARCSPHNWLFLEGLKSALCCDAGYKCGHYRQPPVEGLKAFARIYAGWAYSQGFVNRDGFRDLGFDSIQDLLHHWEQDHLNQDANDLLAVLDTWQRGDISDNPELNGDFDVATARLVMPTRIIPSRSDLYFTADRAREECRLMPGGQHQTLDSDWGHIAGGPGRNPEMTARLLSAAGELL